MLNSCCHFQLHFPIKSKIQCQKQRSLTPVLSFSSCLPDFLYLCRSVSPGPHYHVSSLMYISCAHLHSCFRNHCKRTTHLQLFSEIIKRESTNYIYKRNVHLWFGVLLSLKQIAITLGPGLVLQHDAKMKRKAIFQKFLPKEELGEKPAS